MRFTSRAVDSSQIKISGRAGAKVIITIRWRIHLNIGWILIKALTVSRLVQSHFFSFFSCLSWCLIMTSVICRQLCWLGPNLSLRCGKVDFKTRIFSQSLFDFRSVNSWPRYLIERGQLGRYLLTFRWMFLSTDFPEPDSPIKGKELHLLQAQAIRHESCRYWSRINSARYLEQIK